MSFAEMRKEAVICDYNPQSSDESRNVCAWGVLFTALKDIKKHFTLLARVRESGDIGCERI